MNNPNYSTENVLGELSSRVEGELSPELQTELAELFESVMMSTDGTTHACSLPSNSQRKPCWAIRRM